MPGISPSGVPSPSGRVGPAGRAIDRCAGKAARSAPDRRSPIRAGFHSAGFEPAFPSPEGRIATHTGTLLTCTYVPPAGRHAEVLGTPWARGASARIRRGLWSSVAAAAEACVGASAQECTLATTSVRLSRTGHTCGLPSVRSRRVPQAHRAVEGVAAPDPPTTTWPMHRPREQLAVQTNSIDRQRSGGMRD